VTGVAAGARLRALLGGPQYAQLFAAARAAVEARGPAARTVLLGGLDGQSRAALAGLLGAARLAEETLSLDLDRLDRALRESAAAVGLREALVALGGPLRDVRGERRGRREAAERMWGAAGEALAREDRPELGAWLGGLRRSGLLSRAARLAGRPPEELLDVALRAALALPARGELLAVFAARCTGDPHALDAGRPLGGLVLRAAAAVAGERALPEGSAGRRRLWRAVGVDCDALSADVLVLGLRPEGDALAARQLRECAEAGEPRRLTLREVSRTPLAVRSGTVVHVCENPAVVEAAADALGSRCAPLVCAEGVPSTAALTLLRSLAQRGARVRVHADLDWAGLRIAGLLLAETGGDPWLLSASDYRAAVASSPHGPPLVGRRAPAGWDPALVPAMVEGGRAVLEEQVLGALLEELGRPAGGG